MVLYVLAIVGGVFALALGAERFVNGAAALARRLGISSLIVGLTIVSLGTSFPELLVTVTASLMGHPHVAVGNVLGSNICNIGLILGVSSLVHPLPVSSQLLRREYPLLPVITVLLWLLALNGQIGRLEGIFLTAGLSLFLVWMARKAREESNNSLSANMSEPLDTARLPLRVIFVNLGAGLILLLVGSRALVWGGVAAAHAFGISEIVIGLTLVALGTSLPELAITLAGTIKKEYDIAVGNVVGSNVFNSLGILGIPAMIRPLPIPREALVRDFPALLLISLMLWPICRSWQGRPGRVNRLEGGALLGGYCLYLVVVFSAKLL
jgi:cation:H+ antiporter